MTAHWPLTALLVLVLAVLVKAQIHLIRLAVLGAIGLGGMYMLHLLAQDWNKIRQPPRPAAAVAKLLFKRSLVDTPPLNVSDIEFSEADNEVLDLDHILEQDTIGCARKVVCHLAARPASSLRPQEMNILKVLRKTNGLVKPAQQVFLEAMNLGRYTADHEVCDEHFSKCPYTTQQIFKIITTALHESIRKKSQG